MEKLNDNWAVKGTDFNDFCSELSDLKDRTSFVPFNLCELSVVTPSDVEITTKKGNAAFPMKIHHGEEVAKSTCIGKDNITAKQVSYEEFMHSVENGNLMFLKGTQLIFSSESLYKTLAQRIGFNGSALTNGTCRYQRDALVGALLYEKATHAKACVRTVNGSKKVFSMATSSYQEIPSTIVLDIVDEIKKMPEGSSVQCKSWEISQNIIILNLEFPEIAKEMNEAYGLPDEWVPGVRIVTSDTADSSLLIYSTWRNNSKKNSSVIIQNKVERQHRGKDKTETVISEIIEDAKISIFAEFFRYPETMAALLMTDIDHGDEIELIRSVAKQISLKKAIKNKELYAEIMKDMESKIDPTISYTAYDICSLFLDLPSHFKDMPERRLRDLANVCGKAPFAKYPYKKEAQSLIA